MSFDQSMDGGLVVNTSGGNYSGGNQFTGFLAAVPGATSVSQKFGWSPSSGGVFVIVVVLIIIVMFFVLVTKDKFGQEEEFRNILTTGRAGIRFATSPSDNVSRFSQEDRASDYASDVQSGFINAREPPYFPDVTNRVLRMENREKEAVRALGKINQERLRRASEDSHHTNPLPWGPFWKEWKQTHVHEGEHHHSGFEDDSYAANFKPPY